MKKLLLVALLAIGAANAQDETAVIAEAKSKVSMKMKDPDSAQFRDIVHVAPHGTLKTDLVCGWVNAKNSFGGYVGFRRFVTFGDSALIETGKGDVMDGLLASVWAQCEQPTTKGE